MSIIDEKLVEIEKLVNDGMTSKNAVRALKILGIDGYDEESLKSFRLWNDYMPLDLQYDEVRRNLHILWESVDRVPLGINCAFAIPFRQILAKKLFKSCGDGFVANEGCRFNFANNIEIGKNVSWNAGCYLDAKGGIKLGDFAMLTEYVKIFTHSHSEWDHMTREYKPVVIGDYAKVYTAATILPGVTLGTGAIVATGAIVTKSVEDFTLVGGIPAKPMRKRNFEGDDFAEMNQYMMKDRLFQIYDGE
ncbi:MAG: acyltransferase [Bacteroides sp.]|nr:acyltransferase [Bacillota bacterium]MCM1393801.1 acyltransferase [[Eubacterium] siraeum]MCM1455120.1 acyltransferase [Bacteroides sp.]